MTGFGRSELKSPLGLIRVEIKTVNHKYLEMSSRLPGHLGEFEDAIRKVISQEVRRGKIHVFIACPDPSTLSSRLVLNERLAKEVFEKIKRLEKVLGLKIGEDNAQVLKEVLHYPDVLTKDVSSDGRNLFSRELEKAVLVAAKNLKVSRTREGKALEKDIAGRLSEIKRSLGIIEKRLPAVEKEYKKSLENRMKEFLPAKGGSASGGKNGNLDHERLTLEVALYVKNSDISEEVTRMKSHMDAMRKTFSESGELGRKIDFIAQEMYREANTMGAKSNDVAIAGGVIAIKSAIEKIREQAQNVE